MSGPAKPQLPPVPVDQDLLDQLRALIERLHVLRPDMDLSQSAFIRWAVWVGVRLVEGSLKREPDGEDVPDLLRAPRGNRRRPIGLGQGLFLNPNGSFTHHVVILSYDEQDPWPGDPKVPPKATRKPTTPKTPGGPRKRKPR